MRTLVPFTLALTLAACAGVGLRRYQVTVDSLASNAAAQDKTYLLLPGNKGVTWDDLQFKEYATEVIRVLNARGFTPAKTPDQADVAIVLSYGIGNPQARQYTYSLPVWGQTGIASSTTYGTATAFGNYATYNGTTTYTPTYGIKGYRTETGSVTTYFRYALLTAYDLRAYRASKRQVELWKTTITSTGITGDLRRVFPVLIAAGAPYLGKSTGQQVTVRLTDSDALVKAIRGQPAHRSTTQ